jgi:DNA-binding MarR family transcriptional regulator
MKSNATLPGPHHEALIQLLHTSETIWNASRLLFARWDLSPSQFNILNLLRIHSEGMTQIDLSHQLLTHRSNVTGLIDRMEKRRLVERRDVPGDRRSYRVVLTAEGLSLVQEILPHYYGASESIWEGISVKRAGELARDLAVIATNVEQATSKFEDK